MAGSFQATLDQNQINLGDSVTLNLEIGDGSVTSEPVLPSIPGVSIQASGTQQEVNMVNFHVVRKTIYSYELTPNAVGTFVIPAIQAGVDGQTLSSHPLRITVTQDRSTSTPGSGPAFVELSVPKTNLYFGEVMRAEIKCYFQFAGSVQQPTLVSDGFSASQIVNPSDTHNPPHVMVNGQAYAMFTFPVAVTATKTGRLALGPANWELTVPVGQPNIFGQRQQKRLSVTSSSIPFTVLPVPAPPDSAAFGGAVGDFSLAQFEASPTALTAGDPITLKIRISGRGGFDNLSLPTNQPGWNDFKMYQPTAKFDSSDPLQIEGSKYFEQVVTPQNASIKELPSFEFTFFDPEQKTFRTLTHPPIPITVQPAAATPQPTVITTGAPPPEEQQQGREIVHIKPFFGRAASHHPPLIFRSKFLALQAVPPLAWLAALVWRRRKDSLANNPRLQRQRQVTRIVQEGLAQLPGFASVNDYDQFYAGVSRLLQEQLGERLDLPASAITEAALEDLPRHGVDSASVTLLQDLFQACNQYRYTPEHTAQEMSSIIAKLKQALSALQQAKTRPGRAKAVAQTMGCVLFLVFATSMRAQSPTPTDLYAQAIKAIEESNIPDAFAQANKLYEEGKYPGAEAAYKKIIDSGWSSAALYFNLGNACYKQGHVGKAIEAYRRAEIIDPGDPDVRANLRFARDQVANFAPALPGGRWTRWVGRFTLDAWTICASLSVAVFFGSLILREIRGRGRRSSWSTPILLGVVAVALLSCLGLAINQGLIQKSAVVVSGEAVARRGPLDEAESAFTVHDGAELLVSAHEERWLEVADASGHTGWISQKDLAIIP